MIRAGKRYRRRIAPHTTVTVVRRRHGRVTYRLKQCEMTISVVSFKDIYGKVRRCRKQK